MNTSIEKTTISIGIPALNEENGIGRVVSSLLTQEESNFVISDITVVSDGSTDNTSTIVKSFTDSRVRLVEGTERKGKAVRQNELIEHCTSDIIVFLDADIRVLSNTFIADLVAPLLADTADFTSGNIIAYEPTGVIGKMLSHIMKVKTYVYGLINNGNSVYTCFGPARAFSRKAYEILRFEKVAAEDAFSYLQLTKAGLRFAWARSALFGVTVPTTLDDHQKQSVRFLKSEHDLSRIFGNDFVTKAYAIPFAVAIKGILFAFVSSPFYSLLYIAVFIWMKLKAVTNNKSQFLWERVASTHN